MNERHAQLHMIASFWELYADTEMQHKAHCSNGAALPYRGGSEGKQFSHVNHADRCFASRVWW